MDGMAVLALAGSRPELFGSRVAGVALLSTLAAPLPTAGQGSGDRAMRLRTALAMLAARILRLASPLAHAVHPFRTRPVQRLLRRRLFAGDPPEGAMRQMTDAWIRTPTTVMSATLPVLVLAGAEGRHHPGRRRRAARRPDRPDGPPGARARAGHMVPLTHAPAVNTALLDLLAGARPASDGRRTS